MTATKQNTPRINSTHMLAGMDSDGRYMVHAGRKGQAYKVLPTTPPSADEIKELRKKTELSKEEFAGALGVSVAAVSSWENGSKVPNGITCRFLDMVGKERSAIEKYVK